MGDKGTILYIEDDPGNTTRFLVGGKHDPTATGADLTSIVATAHRNQPGALFKLLQPFAETGIDMTRIESRSVRGSPVPDYYFFIDVQGHMDDPGMKKAIEIAKHRCLQLTVLGSSPKATEVL